MHNFTCDCGHKKASHTEDAFLVLCTDCYISKDEPDSNCYFPWHRFKPNNLKHLERLSK